MVIELDRTWVKFEGKDHSSKLRVRVLKIKCEVGKMAPWPELETVKYVTASQKFTVY